MMECVKTKSDFLTISSPKWREINYPEAINTAFSPKSRQSGEKKHIDISTNNEGIESKALL